MSQLPPKGKPDAAVRFNDLEKGDHMSDHMKAMWAGQSNVLVAVRVRPLMKHDVVKKSCVRVLESNVVVIMDPASGDKMDILRANRSREKQYAFDYVFDPTAKQEHVYNTTTKFLIHGVLDGYNATVFAYGQTGSGKTHTMIGSQTDPGIMVRVMEDLFLHASSQGKQQGVQYKVSVSFLEVYNENIRDLLSDVEEYLDLREDPIKGPVVASITEIEATSGKEVMQLLHQGNAKRSQAATAANEVSSRSHAVLQVVVECRDRAPGTVANIKVGKLSLVDLAGSERAANTKNVGVRLVEGANINRSLLALGNCINALGEKGNKGNFVPYRDSKLTRLLKDSLGGNCRTVMIANISAAESSFEETLNTLKYANRAKNIKTNVQRNVLNVNYHISEYVELINNLRGEIQLLKAQIGPSNNDRVGTAIGIGIGIGIEQATGHSASHVHLHHHDIPDLGGNNGPLRILTPVGRMDGNLPMALRSPGMLKGAPSTPFQALRESLKSGAATLSNEGRELVNQMRQRIVENFQERMQLRRSLIELEDQNVQNSIEVSKRQLLVIQWSEKSGHSLKKNDLESFTKADFAAYILSNGSGDIIEAWQECEQLRKAIIKNNGMKKNIAKRLRHNEKEAENFREELGDKITGEDRRELMALQYQVGRLELENMELEQHRIVHESILKGKDLVIQKLKLQLAVRDRLISRQQAVLRDHCIDDEVGYDQLALLEDTLMGDVEYPTQVPPSPPRNMEEMGFTPGSPAGLGGASSTAGTDSSSLAGALTVTPVKFAAVKYSKHEVQLQPPMSGESHASPSKKPAVPALNIHSAKPRPQLRDQKPVDDTEEDDDEGEVNYEDDTDADAHAKPVRRGDLQHSHGHGGHSNTQSTHLSSVASHSRLQASHVASESEDDGRKKSADDRGNESGEGEEIDDDYNMLPFTEREVALTARDRDLIGEGDWAEIQSELSDNDFSFNDGHFNSKDEKGGGSGKRVKPKVKKAAARGSNAGPGGTKAPSMQADAKAAEVKARSNAPAGGGPAVVAQQAAAGGGKDSKGVHGPRGGRLYRSSVPDDVPGPAPAFPAQANARRGGSKVAPLPAEDYSDDEFGRNALIGGQRGKYRHYNSPRRDKEAPGKAEGTVMPPLVQHQEEIGVLSGRRYASQSNPGSQHSLLALSDLSPRADNAALVYPLNNNGGGGGGRSKAARVEDEVLDLEVSVEAAPPAAALVVKSKGLGKALSKRNKENKETPQANAYAYGGAGGSSGNSNNNNINSNVASDASLITVEGLSAGVNINRPANRLKPSGRPSKPLIKSALGASPSNQDEAGAAPSGMPNVHLASEFAADFQQELGVKIKSLPVLSKQLGHLGISPRAENK